MIVRFCFVVLIFLAVSAAYKDKTDFDNEDIPRLDLAHPENGYHGLIKENETTVEVTPPIRAIGPICSFLIRNNKHHGEAPFEVVLVNDNEATLRVHHTLNCEKRRNYKFDIAAVGCDGSYSEPATVHITVVDVNEYAPVFAQPSYIREVDEGQLYKEIVTVEATDRDCTPKYGDVCKYEILTPDQPFTIDNEGVIRNTEPLDYERSHNHILSVVAYDCGMRQSTPVMVTIRVSKPCKAGWKGLAERVDYAPGSGPLSLFPVASLSICNNNVGVCGTPSRIEAAVTLKSSHIGKGCDRDTYSVRSQRRICGASSQSVDLLPSPGIGNEWTKTLKTDEGRESDQIFEFDGETTAAVVPESILSHSLAGTFSISTWMRHAYHPDQDKHTKEHVLCLADDHKMNRHHYALFVRNCRLILLLRRDFGEGDLNIFRPAEWRWKIPEVCDNEWHHYSVNVRFPNVELFIDGELYRSIDGKSPEVIDDWPLHPTKGINTTLTIGACWQGSDAKMKHHLKGSLAGLNILLNGVEGRQQLKCLSQCREGLNLAPDLYLSSVSVEGDSLMDVETLLRKVSYTNSRSFPTPGRRNVHIATTITCENGRTLKALPAESFIMVLQPQTPLIVVNGTSDAARDYTHFRAASPVFPDISISVLNSDGHGVKDAASQKLDSCVVSVYPALNPDHETLSIRDGSELPLRYDIRASVNHDGVILTGADSVHNYQKVLRQIEYTNKKPAYYLNRVFKLSCSELNGRFTSNEYVQTLTVVHPHMSANSVSQAGMVPRGHADLHTGMADKLDPLERHDSAKHPEPSHQAPHGLHHGPPRQYVAHNMMSAHSIEMTGPRVLDLEGGPSGNGGDRVALLIGVVCAGFLVLAAAVFVARARAAPRRRRRATKATPSAPTTLSTGTAADAEMAWDDSALTITVNPMDTTNEKVPVHGETSEGESCSDSESEHNDSSDEEDERVVVKNNHKYKNVNQLEWDNSTM